MEQKELHTLRLTAARVRDLAMDMVHTAASGHIGGSLSVADILTTLYFKVMSVDPAKPRATAPPPSTPPWLCGATSRRRS